MRIFVTYSHEDRVVVDLLIQDICQLGHTVWYDQQLTAGHVWWDEVLQQIISAELIIAAISPAWLRTHSCQLELSYAYELNKRILPIMIAPLDYEILPEILQRLTVIPYIHQQNPMVIAKAIQNLPPERPLPNPLPPPPEAPLSELGRLQQQVRAPHLTFEVQKSLV
ncbi:MAG: toll/interleukin-1 receptor domain-containing protein, partial [Chloroflexi bacterium]